MPSRGGARWDPASSLHLKINSSLEISFDTQSPRLKAYGKPAAQTLALPLNGCPFSFQEVPKFILTFLLESCLVEEFILPHLRRYRSSLMTCPWQQGGRGYVLVRQSPLPACTGLRVEHMGQFGMLAELYHPDEALFTDLTGFSD